MGLGQAEFGASAGVARKTQFNYETGERLPDAAYLAVLLGMGVDVLYVLSGSRSFVPPDPLSPREAVLLDNYRRLAAEAQRSLEGIAAQLAAGASSAAASASRQVARGAGARIGGSGDTTHYHGPVDNIAGRDVRYINKVKKPKPPSEGGA